MGGTSSTSKGQVLAPAGPAGPPEPPYPGPAAEYNFINTQVSMTNNISFSTTHNMVTTNIDSYYPILGQKYAEGFRLLTFYRIPGGAQRQGGLFSMSMAIPFQGVFCRYPQMPSQQGWQLRVVKSVMVAQRMGHGLIQLNPQIVGDSSQIYQAIVDNTNTGGRLICIEMTGQQQGQGFSAAMQGISPIMGVDLFFEIPNSPMSERYLYQCVPCPVHIQANLSFGTSGVRVMCDWNGMLGSQLSQGWKLVEIFFDMGQARHGAFSTSASLNSVWFFEKPSSRANDNTPVYQGTVVEHFVSMTSGFGGVHATTNWEPIIQQLGLKGWELACFVETPESRMTGFGKAEMKVLLFFQRPILPPVGVAHHPMPGPAQPHPGGPAPPAAGFLYDQGHPQPPSNEKPPPYQG
ncbi:uncharacterized protein [Haliotis cracherodii]|uniref:uncharacterized protein n=1 Tax=Haliotis cracherodii TaxID=6455 RepID=UPI0039ED3FDE